ncbi:MAG TPA: S4 domain-containing protein, partial [Anaerolineales bacterium]|nr:S4 domain-containing protein [Anaerolineales bacterium]
MVHTFQTLNPDRLDRHVVAQVPDVSRNQAQRLIENGHVIVAGQVVVKPAASVAAGVSITVDIPAPAPTTAVAEDIPLDIVFENVDVIVINKPPGMVVHPGAGHASGTLVNAVLGHDPELEGVGDEAR